VDIISTLTRNPIFAYLDASALKDVAAITQIRHFRSGEWIVHYGDIWPYLFLIKSGEVIAVKESSEGRSLILTAFLENELFWGLAFFIHDAPMPAALRASEDSEILIWSHEDLIPFLLQNGRFSWELSCLMIQRVQLASEIVEKLAFQPVAGRLARLLVEFSGTDSMEPIARSLTLEDMAARIGSTREVVCRFLHRFASEGLIDITRTEFLVKDLKRLENLARQGKG
jgi:CRP/FNR family transcriptional regulator